MTPSASAMTMISDDPLGDRRVDWGALLGIPLLWLISSVVTGPERADRSWLCR